MADGFAFSRLASPAAGSFGPTPLVRPVPFAYARERLSRTRAGTITHLALAHGLQVRRTARHRLSTHFSFATTIGTGLCDPSALESPRRHPPTAPGLYKDRIHRSTHAAVGIYPSVRRSARLSWLGHEPHGRLYWLRYALYGLMGGS